MMPSGRPESEPEAECYNPVCSEPVKEPVPPENEAYCSWDCAVMARSGAADRLRREAQ